MLADEINPGFSGDPLEIFVAVTDLIPGKPGWFADALCKEYPSGWWFPTEHDVHAADKAKEVCSRCTVTTDCLAYALGQGSSLEGIWAGTSRRARGKMRKTAA